MKYDLSKLSKDKIETIIKSLPPHFEGLYCYAPSHTNKMLKVITPKKDGFVELFDEEKKLYDQWGEYNTENNSLYVQACHTPCGWAVGVYLYEDHFEIPKYKDSINNYESKKNFANYRKVLNEIFAAIEENNLSI